MDEPQRKTSRPGLVRTPGEAVVLIASALIILGMLLLVVVSIDAIVWGR